MSRQEDTPLCLERYLGRVGFAGPIEVSASVLRSLHAAHLGAIPFENIDVRLGRRIALDLGSLQAKLVERRRGGYCFEQNTLFAAVLRQVGFEVATLEARVRPPGATSTLPRTHMILAVEVEGGRCLADVGFGGDGPLQPVPLDGRISDEGAVSYRVEPEGNGIFALRRQGAAAWEDLYAFSLAPALGIDFEVASHFTSTHPSSIFVNTLTVQRSTRVERRILRGRSYTLRRAGMDTVREIAPDELPRILGDDFGLDLSEEEAEALAALI